MGKTISQQADLHPEKLRRSRMLWEVTASGVGIIIGAGIYVLLGSAAEQAGSVVWLSFVLTAGLNFLTGLSYAELSSMFPRASAGYEFTRQAFPRWVAFALVAAFLRARYSAENPSYRRLSELLKWTD